MEFRHLVYFVAVAEEKHFGNAARRLRIAQPPLSQQIKTLEKTLGVQLLERTTRKVELTPAGQVLLERARVLLAEIETLERDLERIDAGAQGILRLGSSGSAAYGVLPRIVREARHTLPGLELELRGEVLTPEMVTGLLEHRLDVGLLRLPVSEPEIATQVIQSDELQVALPAEHPLAGEQEIELNALRQEPLVTYPLGSAVHAVTAEICRRAGFQPRVVQVVQETSTLISIVAGGAGLSVIPEPVAALGTRSVVFKPIAGRPTMDLAAAWRRDDERPLVKALLEVIRHCTTGRSDPVPDEEETLE